MLNPNFWRVISACERNWVEKPIMASKAAQKRPFLKRGRGIATMAMVGVRLLLSRDVYEVMGDGRVGSHVRGGSIASGGDCMIKPYLQHVVLTITKTVSLVCKPTWLDLVVPVCSRVSYASFGPSVPGTPPQRVRGVEGENRLRIVARYKMKKNHGIMGKPSLPRVWRLVATFAFRSSSHLSLGINPTSSTCRWYRPSCPLSV